VLIAELDNTVRMITVDLLEDEGFRTQTADSTDEVLAILEGTDEVHTLITGRSVRWSGDGIELAHRVHALWPNIRIIVTSGAGGDVLQALPPGVRFLRKPYSHMLLVREVEDGFPLTDDQPSSAPVVPRALPAMAGVSGSVGIELALAPMTEPDKI
jgi:DNA-binding NtrC family response regulator